MSIFYKLTDSDGYTQRGVAGCETRWDVGVTVLRPAAPACFTCTAAC